MINPPPRKKQTHYDLLTRLFHWIMAVAIIYNMVFGYIMFLIEDTYPVIYNFIGEINVSIASVVAILFIFRWVWSHFRNEPKSKCKLSLLQKKTAHFFHSTLYLNMFIVYLSGFLMLKHSIEVFWLIELANPVTNPGINNFFFIMHRYSCISLTLFVLTHILAAVKHHFIGRNNVLIKMLGPKFTLRETK